MYHILYIVFKNSKNIKKCYFTFTIHYIIIRHYYNSTARITGVKTIGSLNTLKKHRRRCCQA